MGYVETKCPHCGHKFKDSCNSWCYGSPIRKCPACREEYVDKRFREVAAVGFDPRSTNSSFYFKASFLSLAAAIATAAWTYYRYFYCNRIAVSFGLFAIVCVFLTIFCLVQTVRIKTGAQDKANEKHMKESRERLKDKAYAQKLSTLGFNVPEEFLK